MYIELLEQYGAKYIGFKIQTAVTKREICIAEKELNTTFPRELSELLLETNGDNYLLLSLNQIVKYNQDFRDLNPNIIKPSLFQFNEYLFIATNGCGDYYGYKIKDGSIQSTNIIIFEHEEYKSRIVAKNLAELIEYYYKNQI